MLSLCYHRDSIRQVVRIRASQLQLADAFGDMVGAGLELFQLVIGQLEFDDFFDALASELDGDADELAFDAVLPEHQAATGRMRFSSRTMLWTICTAAAEGA